jgi:anti-sigma B factor antagonist
MLRRFLRGRRRADVPGVGLAPAGRLRLEVSHGPRRARMALYGEFDIASADDAGRALEDLLGRGLDHVVVDLSGLDFMDSTGIKFLIDGRDTARERGVTLSLVPGDDPVRRVLTVSGVTALFEAVDDDEARRD